MKRNILMASLAVLCMMITACANSEEPKTASTKDNGNMSSDGVSTNNVDETEFKATDTVRETSKIASEPEVTEAFTVPTEPFSYVEDAPALDDNIDYAEDVEEVHSMDIEETEEEEISVDEEQNMVTEAITDNNSGETDEVTKYDYVVYNVVDSEATSFEEINRFITDDPKYDESEIKYEIYLKKVMLNAGSEHRGESIFVVGAKTMRLSKGVIKETTIAATDGFLDNTRAEGPLMPSAKTWLFFDGREFSAQSIIDVCVSQAEQMGVNTEELPLYEEVVLVSTF